MSTKLAKREKIKAATSLQPVPYRYQGPGPMPPRATDEAILILSEYRGEAAAAELKIAIDELTAQIAQQKQGILNGTVEGIDLVNDLFERRAIYRDRWSRLAEILDTAPLDNPTDSLDDVVRILASHQTRSGHLSTDLEARVGIATRELERTDADLLAVKTVASANEHFGHLGNDPVGPWLAAQAEQIGESIRALRQALNERLPAARIPIARLNVEAEQLALDYFKHGARVTRRRWAQDSLVEWLDTILARRTELRGRLAVLSEDQTRIQQAVAEKVRAAISEAGGDRVVTNAIVSARALQSPIAASALDAEIRRLDDDAGRLNESGVTTGAAVDALATRRAEAVRQVDALRTEGRRRQTAAAGALLLSASVGQESSRAELQRLAQSVPSAFPAGFAASLAAARADLALLAELT